MQIWYIIKKYWKLTKGSKTIIPYGQLNKEGREEFLALCESVQLQTRYEHPHYPKLEPYMVASICKRFLGQYAAQEYKFRDKIK